LATGNNAKMIELWSVQERKVIASYKVEYNEKYNEKIFEIGMRFSRRSFRGKKIYLYIDTD
jgi:hypothetical protein